MSQFTSQVQIGPTFFSKAFNDYSDWRWALIREFFQNSADCGSRNISFTIEEAGRNTKMVVQNDGRPMSKTELVDKLLAIGESGKEFHGTVGGFGRAKELLLFCHESYTIRTGNMYVAGSGAGYDLTENLEPVHGTTTEIIIEDDHVESLTKTARRFFATSQWRGTLTLNGEERRTSLKKGAFRRDLGFAKVYTNNSGWSNRVIVRSGGMPMFVCSTDLDKCVIVELKRPKRGSEVNRQVLASNRDGLRYPYANHLNDFLVDLVTNKRKALKSRTPRYTRYRGAKLTYRAPAIVSKIINEVLAEVAPKEQQLVIAPANAGTAAAVVATSPVAGGVPLVVPGDDMQGNVIESSEYEQDDSEREMPVRVALGTEFVIKNETDMVIPRHFLPDSGHFSTYSQKLIKMWVKVLFELHQLFKHEAAFGVGFVFDDQPDDDLLCAQHETNGPYGEIYYINPAQVVRQPSGARSFSKRVTLTQRYKILSEAVHEFVHGLGYDTHDEAYANKLTDVFEVVMANRRRFTKCFA